MLPFTVGLIFDGLISCGISAFGGMMTASAFCVFFPINKIENFNAF